MICPLGIYYTDKFAHVINYIYKTMSVAASMSEGENDKIFNVLLVMYIMVHLQHNTTYL